MCHRVSGNGGEAAHPPDQWKLSNLVNCNEMDTVARHESVPLADYYELSLVIPYI